jgi:hypothetical protein
VPDQLAPLENRPGNESAVVPVPATGRYHGRPMLEIPAPLANVPQLRTPEPGAEPLHFPLDLTPFLPPGALTAARVRAERASAAAVVAACLATPDGRILGRPVEPTGPGDGDIEIPVPNPDDQAELAAALGTGLSTAVADRFLVYLAGRHPYRDRLFVPAQDNPQPAGPSWKPCPRRASGGSTGCARWTAPVTSRPGRPPPGWWSGCHRCCRGRPRCGRLDSPAIRRSCCAC